MWERYSEPLSLDEIADTAILSKFYFSRVFRSITGTSPGRFLTAIRLYRAKNLLQKTSLSVTDIAYMVGYNSLGTFTTRFTKSVGMSPARFRVLSHSGLPALPRPETDSYPGSGELHGTVVLPPNTMPLRVYVGAFGSPIVEGMPVSCDILDTYANAEGCQVHEYRLSEVPVGKWYVRAAAVAVRWADSDIRPWARRPLFLGSGKSIVMLPDHTVELHIPMRAVDSTDLPILLALPELDNRFFPEPMLSA
ncbi:helix-turn-helix transcriptional regulator [Jatrophihabitans sp.]|uniref:helix-turn-helix transcriptional regulator n=1 Tax=Jatrophihabitans sp. TaxID=1932789 RepID=UPI002BF1C5CD|nr:helix-turn-helix transcriptional regulator [Jatrophihabitans sp.]